MNNKAFFIFSLPCYIPLGSSALVCYSMQNYLIIHYHQPFVLPNSGTKPRQFGHYKTLICIISTSKNTENPEITFSFLSFFSMFQKTQSRCHSNSEYRWKKSQPKALEICQSWQVSMYRFWKILLMVRGLHDSWCASQMLLRPCRFSSTRMASPMCGSSFMRFALCRALPRKKRPKESVETFCITFRCGFISGLPIE